MTPPQTIVVPVRLGVLVLQEVTGGPGSPAPGAGTDGVEDILDPALPTGQFCPGTLGGRTMGVLHNA